MIHNEFHLTQIAEHSWNNAMGLDTFVTVHRRRIVLKMEEEAILYCIWPVRIHF